MDWEQGAIRLYSGDSMFVASASPYSPGCSVAAPLVVVSTFSELEAVKLQGKIVLLRGEIAREQLMPKNFPFYNPEDHKRIIRLLEEKQPEAIIAATSRNPELAGGMYPFPLIEDGDFDIPSAYMTDEEGDRLAVFNGRRISIDMENQRIPASGKNVIVRKNPSADKRIVICAHIDAKMGTPGAIDNAAGIVTLILLAELFKDYVGKIGIEILAVNGEDYYSASGEIEYLKRSRDYFADILLAVNLDGAGYIHGGTVYSLYELPTETAETFRRVFSRYDGISEGEAWYQSDHMIFVMNGCPAAAVTSEQFQELSREITHTAKDRPEIVDTTRLVTLSQALADLAREINRID